MEHAGSCSPHPPVLGSADHGRPRRAPALFRSAPESFGSAQRWTNERVSATWGLAGLWERPERRTALDPGVENFPPRGLSPVAFLVPAHPGSPTDPACALALAQWAWKHLGPVKQTLEPSLPLVIS